MAKGVKCSTCEGQTGIYNNNIKATGEKPKVEKSEDEKGTINMPTISMHCTLKTVNNYSPSSLIS